MKNVLKLLLLVAVTASAVGASLRAADGYGRPWMEQRLNAHRAAFKPGLCPNEAFVKRCNVTRQKRSEKKEAVLLNARQKRQQAAALSAMVKTGIVAFSAGPSHGTGFLAAFNSLQQENARLAAAREADKKAQEDAEIAQLEAAMAGDGSGKVAVLPGQGVTIKRIPVTPPGAGSRGIPTAQARRLSSVSSNQLPAAAAWDASGLEMSPLKLDAAVQGTTEKPADNLDAVSTMLADY